jgi:hypothetical protein
MSDSIKSIEQSIESLQANLAKAPDEATRLQISKLIAIGQDHAAMFKSMNATHVEPVPSKPSLKVNPKRILNLLRLFGTVAIAFVLVLVALNLLSQFLPGVKP